MSSNNVFCSTGLYRAVYVYEGHRGLDPGWRSENGLESWPCEDAEVSRRRSCLGGGSDGADACMCAMPRHALGCGHARPSINSQHVENS